MQRIQRSPPSIKGSQHTQSDSDVSKLEEQGSSVSFVSQRQKRRRGSSDENMSSFKDEIRQMLSDIKDSQNVILNKLVSDIAEIKAQNLKIQQTNLEIEKSMELISAQYENTNKKIDSLEKERKLHVLQISDLEKKLEDIQRSLKSTTVEIRNLPLPSKNDLKPDLKKIVMDTCRVLNVTVHDNDIKTVFDVKGKTGKSTIVVDFTRTTTKLDIVRMAKEFNKKHPNQRLDTIHLGLAGAPTPVYISEALTAKGRRLFFLARDLASAAGYKYCWTTNGRVFMRMAVDSPHIEIKSEADLSKLRNLQ